MSQLFIEKGSKSEVETNTMPVMLGMPTVHAKRLVFETKEL